jgi:hypothetical protein
MSTAPASSLTRLWLIRAFLVLFVLSAAGAAWFGIKQQQLHGAKSDGKPQDPYKDQSLFGR